MAYRIAPVLVTLNDLEGHSPVAGLFKCNSSSINFVQHSTRFQLISCSRGPSATAGLLVSDVVLSISKMVELKENEKWFSVSVTLNYSSAEFFGDDLASYRNSSISKIIELKENEKWFSVSVTGTSKMMSSYT